MRDQTSKTLFQKFPRQGQSRVQGKLRRRVAACAVVLLILTTGAAIANIYLRNLFPFLDSTGFSPHTAIPGKLT